MQANYHPYEFVSVYRHATLEDFSSVVSTKEVSQELHDFFGRIDGVTPRECGVDEMGKNRFVVNCGLGHAKRHIRKWATAWREARKEFYPPVDIVHVRGRETADIEDICEKMVCAHLRNGRDVTGKVVSIASDYDDSGRLCIAHIKLSDGNRNLSFDEVREFEILSE